MSPEEGARTRSISPDNPLRKRMSDLQISLLQIEAKLSDQLVRTTSTPFFRKIKDLFVEHHIKQNAKENPYNPLVWQSFIAKNLNLPTEKIAQYHQEFFNEIQPFLDEKERLAQKKLSRNYLGGKMVCVDTLYCLARAKKPQVVVETGLGQGASAITIMRALQKNRAEGIQGGKLYTVSYPDEDYVETNGSLITYEDNWQSKWAEVWELVEGDSMVQLPQLLNRVPRVDMFIHDSEHTLPHMLGEYGLIYPHIPPGGIIASDDAGLPMPFTRPFETFCETLDIPHIVDRNFGFGFIPKKTE